MAISTPTVALGLLGALLAPLALRPAQFVSLLLVGAFLGSFAALLARSVSENRALDTRESLVHAGRNGLVGSVWAVAAGGLVFSLGSYGWAAVVVAVLGYTLVRVTPRLPRRPQSTPAVRGALEAPPLAGCTTAELRAGWAASDGLLQAASSPASKARIVALRAAYLDELERRDLEGVRHWVRTGVGPANGTGQYLSADDEVDRGPS